MIEILVAPFFLEGGCREDILHAKLKEVNIWDPAIDLRHRAGIYPVLTTWGYSTKCYIVQI